MTDPEDEDFRPPPPDDLTADELAELDVIESRMIDGDGLRRLVERSAVEWATHQEHSEKP